MEEQKADDANTPTQDGGKQLLSSRTLTWTLTKTPATSVGEAMRKGVHTAARANNLCAGVPAMKITSRGVFKSRVLTISQDYLAVFCTHTQIKGGGGSGGTVLSTVASKLPLPPITRKGIWGLTGDLRERYVRYMDVADMDYVSTGTVTTRNLEQSRTRNRLKGKDSKVDVQKQEIVTIGHHGDKTLDVLVSSKKERVELIACLKLMQETYKEASIRCSHEALLLRYIWYDVDANRDGRISFGEFAKMLSRINFFVKNPRNVYRQFCKARKIKPSHGLSLDEILALLQVLKDRSGSMSHILWNELLGDDDSDVICAADWLTLFVHGAQGEKEKKMKDVRKSFLRLNTMEIDHHEGEPPGLLMDEQLSRARFEVFLYHEDNAAYDPEKKEAAPKDLTLPISRYFINTSHNTYLTGDQLQSASSVEMYSRALRRGCKCLELDCWDGEGNPKKGSDDSLHPVVFHGHTLTSKILFGDILQVVRNYLSDEPESYPIILSLENHCSHPFQRVMAKLLVESFGSKLYVPHSTLSGDLPSPESLRGMVVIKGKRPPDPDDGPEATEDGDDEDPYVTEASPGQAKKSKADSNGKAPKPPKVVKELARLTLFHGTKWKSFEQSILEPQSHMHSIGEGKIGKIVSKAPSNAALWRKYNVDHMSRTYPAGARVDSSNYGPLTAWAVGCQLVALNFQTNDAPLVVNDGLFRQQRGCGYLRKPAVTESNQAVEDAKSDTITLSVRVLSGSCLPKPKGAKSGEYIDPYVVVVLHDVKNIHSTPTYVSSSHSTSVIDDNGFCPIWNEKQATDFTVHSPDIAVLEFGLREADITLDDDVGFAAIPFNCIRTGYRSVQMYDENNTRSGPFSCASLLVEIRVRRTRA